MVCCCLLPTVQMFLPSLTDILENIPHLVQISPPFNALEMNLDWLIADTLTQPHVEYLVLLEFAAKGRLLQVYIYICYVVCTCYTFNLCSECIWLFIFHNFSMHPFIACNMAEIKVWNIFSRSTMLWGWHSFGWREGKDRREGGGVQQWGVGDCLWWRGLGLQGCFCGVQAASLPTWKWVYTNSQLPFHKARIMFFLVVLIVFIKSLCIHGQQCVDGESRFYNV